MKPAKPKHKALVPAPQVAVRTVIQILSATGRRHTVDGLRERLRELYRQEGNYEVRAVASMSNVELIAALLDANAGLAPYGLQLSIVNGEVSLGTTRIEHTRLREWIASQGPTVSATDSLSLPAKEVLGCIALRQPISQIEINRILGEDKRGVVGRLREAGLVEEFTGEGGRLMFATTETFLRRFGLSSNDELRRMLGSPPGPAP